MNKNEIGKNPFDMSRFFCFLKRLTARSAEADLLLFSHLVAMTNPSSSSKRRISHHLSQPLVLSI